MVDLTVLAAPIAESQWPLLPCPTCEIGVLNVKHLKGIRDAATNRASKHEAFEPDWITGVFTGLLECANSACVEPIVLTGGYSVGASKKPPDGTWSGEFEDYYQLRYAKPALAILVPPKDTPGQVAQAIRAASEVIWADPNAAANRLRLAVEELLTKKGIAKTFVSRDHKRKPLMVSQRLKLYEEKNPRVAKLLEAVKWIGNSGSHTDKVSVRDVLDGAEILGYALRELYDSTDSNLERLVTQIIKSKGLPKKRGA